MRLTLNSHERFSERSGRWYRLVEPYNSGCNIPSQYEYLIPFGLYPLHPTQPSGALNCSKMENIVLIIHFQRGLADSRLDIFAWSWNIFKIRSGMGGPAYAS